MRLILMAVVLLLAGCPTQKTEGGWILDDEGRPAIWRADRLPQKVVVDLELRAWSSAYEEAAAWWNQELGFPVFVFDGSVMSLGLQPDTVYVTYDPEADKTFTRVSQFRSDGSIIAAQIFHPRTDWIRLSSGMSSVIAAHELGHALGLDHDNNAGTIMHPETIPYLDSLDVLDITSEDRRRLKEAYGRQGHRP